MDFSLNLLAKLLMDSGVRVEISCGEEVLERLLLHRCVQALRDIREVLDDDTLNDPECFRRIEKIVEIYEALDVGTGSRHDF